MRKGTEHNQHGGKLVEMVLFLCFGFLNQTFQPSCPWMYKRSVVHHNIQASPLDCYLVVSQENTWRVIITSTKKPRVKVQSLVSSRGQNQCSHVHSHLTTASKSREGAEGALVKKVQLPPNCNRSPFIIVSLNNIRYLWSRAKQSGIV